MGNQLVQSNLQMKNKSCQRSLPLTTKPVLYVANVDEDVVSEPDSIDYVKQFVNSQRQKNAEVVVISARAEEEISELDEEDKQEFLEALGLTESGVDKLTRAAYHLLGLGTYFTAGEKEVRAWTFQTWYEGSLKQLGLFTQTLKRIYSCSNHVI